MGILEKKLEVLIIEDDECWINNFERCFTRNGYLFETVQGSYEAIHDLAIKIHDGEKLPDIYLSDMLERKHIIAKMKDRDGRMVDVHPAMAFNLYNYLTDRDKKPEFLIGSTAYASEEDIAVAKSLGIPLFKKSLAIKLFPDVNGLSHSEALERFRENLAKTSSEIKNGGFR